MNFFVVIIHLTVDSIINAFSSPLRPFGPKRNISTIVASVSFSEESLILLILSKRVFLWFDLCGGDRRE